MQCECSREGSEHERGVEWSGVERAERSGVWGAAAGQARQADAHSRVLSAPHAMGCIDRDRHDGRVGTAWLQPHATRFTYVGSLTHCAVLVLV